MEEIGLRLLDGETTMEHNPAYANAMHRQVGGFNRSEALSKR